ncbi:MAG: hypothetical protein M3464_01280 [Chloroflexota bacterium]|nr:hypothetical protein [Chloroflexota bacterium]
MDPLIAEAWHLYHGSEDISCVVRPSIPILYFGDSGQYSRSPLKVITVGLNPSWAEFPIDDPFKRFPKAQHVYPDILNGSSNSEYLAALNDYFRCDPYMGWFGTLEPLLDGMEAGYRDGRTNVALHTDLFSPLATAPTWSKLTQERSILGLAGMRLWHRLVRHLAPDVILVSVAQQHLASLDFSPLGCWETIHKIERANPYRVDAREVEVVPGRKTLIVFGRAAQKPFGMVSTTAKREIGQRVAEYVGGR